jgi:hypothetical protein
MSEKSVRGAGPGVDQAPDPAAPAAPGRAGATDSGAAPVEPWGGERTDRVSGREGSGARVALVPAAGANGRVEDPSSTADTSRMADSGRTTLLGVPSPMAGLADKPTTSPGHDVHLPTEKSRAADKRPVAGESAPRTVERAPASSPGVGVEPPAKSSGDVAGQHGGEKNAKSDLSGQNPQHSPNAPGDPDRKAGPVVANERTMAAAAATFRASSPGGNKQPGSEVGREPERAWTADRTQEFHLASPPPVQGAFGKTLAAAIAIAAGTGILVVGFIHARVRGGAADPSESARAAGALPIAPVPLPPPPLPENPVPPLPVDPTNEAPQPAQPEAAAGQALPQPAPAGDAADDTGREERRLAVRPRAPTPAGRTAPSGRTPRVSPTIARPGVASPPGAAPSPTAQAPGAGPPTTPPPLTPPPLTVTPPPEKPAIRPDPPRTEGAKPYDPDMPLPPSME